MNKDRSHHLKISRRSLVYVLTSGASAAFAAPLFANESQPPVGKKAWNKSNLTEVTEGTHILSPIHGGRSGVHGLGILDINGNTLKAIPTDVLGHSIIFSPSNPYKVVMFGQRPGRESCVVDLRTNRQVIVFKASPGRHFYGHGRFSGDGKLIYATENDNRTGDGFIVIRDASTLKVLGDFPSYGYGPHDLVFVNNGDILVVANGGIKRTNKSPEYIEEPVVDHSNISFVDVKTRKLVNKVSLGLKQVSLRHLLIGRDGYIFVGTKTFKGAHKALSAAIIGPDGKIRPLQFPRSIEYRSDIGLSLAQHPKKDILAITHPTGNSVSFWKSSGEYLGLVLQDKAEGVVATPEGGYFVTTTAEGKIRFIDPETHLKKPVMPTLGGLNWKHSTLWMKPS